MTCGRKYLFKVAFGNIAFMFLINYRLGTFLSSKLLDFVVSRNGKLCERQSRAANEGFKAMV